MDNQNNVPSKKSNGFGPPKIVSTSVLTVMFHDFWRPLPNASLVRMQMMVGNIAEATAYHWRMVVIRKLHTLFVPSILTSLFVPFVARFLTCCM